MAELQFPNIVGQFLQGQQLGRQRAAEDRAQAAQTRLGELAQLAYQAPADQRGQFIGEAVGINPEAGLALDKQFSAQDDAREQRLLSTARLIAAAPEPQKAAIFAQVRPQIAQYLPNLPETYNDQVGQGINAFIQSRSGAAGGAKVVGNALVDANGNVIYQAPQRFQTDQGLIEVGQDGVRELRIGAPTSGAQVGPIGDVQAGTGFTIDPSIPPEVAAQIRAQEAAQGGVAMGAPQGQRILPRGTSEAQTRLQLAQDANARAAAADARAAQAFENAQRGQAPTGFRFRADGSLEPIPGGPTPAGAAATEGEREAATLLSRLEFSERQLQDAVAANPDAASPSVAASVAGSLPFVGEQARNLANSPERQRVEAAQLDILDAALTLGTGAAYTREQLEGYRRSYFPQIGDSQATIDDKAARLQNVINSARIAAGRAAQQEQPQTPAPQAAPVQRARNPQTGQIIELRNGQWVPVNG
jgi:hypothetical protein